MTCLPGRRLPMTDRTGPARVAALLATRGPAVAPQPRSGNSQTPAPAATASWSKARACPAIPDRTEAALRRIARAPARAMIDPLPAAGIEGETARWE